MAQLPGTAETILEQRNPGLRRVHEWEVVEESETTITYKVTFTEVVMGTKGIDTDTFEVPKEKAPNTIYYEKFKQARLPFDS